MVTHAALGAAESLRALSEWSNAPETQAWFRRAAEDAVAHVDRLVRADTSLRVPHDPEQRKDGMQAWLARASQEPLDKYLEEYRERLAAQVSSEFARQYPALADKSGIIAGVVRELVWPGVEETARQRFSFLLQGYAIRGLSLFWMSENINDGFLLGIPQEGETWQVPIVDRGTREQVGTLTLNRNGDVLTDAATLRETLLHD